MANVFACALATCTNEISNGKSMPISLSHAHLFTQLDVRQTFYFILFQLIDCKDWEFSKKQTFLWTFELNNPLKISRFNELDKEVWRKRE